MDILALGGLNLDILGQSEGPIVPGDSNPGSVGVRAGGVCHNIAAELAGMGHRVSLLSCLGRDRFSALLREICAAEGIDTRLCLDGGGNAGVYLCLHAPDGEIAAALNDMRCMNALTADAVLSRLEGCRPDLMVLDCNLPADTLAAVAEAWGSRVPVFLDPVSVFKAERCLPILRHLAAIKPNLTEARRLTGQNDPFLCAGALLDGGVKRVFISMGKDGVLFASEKERGVCPAAALPEGTPLTGAGDALCAGLISGMLLSLSAAGCAELGVRTAARRLTRPGNSL